MPLPYSQAHAEDEKTDAEKLATELEPSEKRYLRFDKQGLLLSCFYIDTRIADDAPTTGVIIAEIRLD